MIYDVFDIYYYLSFAIAIKFRNKQVIENKLKKI